MGVRQLDPARAPALEAPPSLLRSPPDRLARVQWLPRSLGQVMLLGLAGLVGAWAFAPFVTVAIDAATHHRVFLGVSGFYPNDGLQYLAWARDAQNGLIRNLYGTVTDRAVFLHPMWTLSGLAEAYARVSPVAVMAFWKAVSAVVLVAGCVRLVKRHIRPERPGLRTVALTLALFGGLTPLAALIGVLDVPGDAWGDFTRAAFELTPAVTLWDYAPLAISIGLIPFLIERIERLLHGEQGLRLVVTTALLGMLAAWLHPWQGETVIVICLGLGVWHRAERGREHRLPYRSLLCVLAATAAPILYYLSLSWIDAGWAIAERNNVAICLIPWPVFVTCVLPLVALVPLAGRRLLRDSAVRPLLLWPAAQMLSVAVSHSGQYRAIDGLVIPIAVLAVKAWGERTRSVRGRLAMVAVLLCTLAPCAVFAVDAFRSLGSPASKRYTEPAPSDVRAASLAARFAGDEPILAPPQFGTAIPVLTDKASWVGHQVWTPDVSRRWGPATFLFKGVLTADAARALVRRAGSRALVEPCGFSAQLAPLLEPLGFHELRVGCARVYVRN